ncbi:hypothetical protein ACLMJK_009467 [Lecanora helva]
MASSMLYAIASCMILGHAVSAQQPSILVPSLTPPPPVSSANPTVRADYPICAQECANSTVPASGCDPYTLDCACSVDYRGRTAQCADLTCNTADYQATLQLADELCGSLYQNNTALGANVTAALAAAQSSAVASRPQGKDPADMNSYPQCANDCIYANNFGGCGEFTNKTCICTDPAFVSGVGACQLSHCSQADLLVLEGLAIQYCAPYLKNSTAPAPTDTPASSTSSKMRRRSFSS